MCKKQVALWVVAGMVLLAGGVFLQWLVECTFKPDGVQYVLFGKNDAVLRAEIIGEKNTTHEGERVCWVRVMNESERICILNGLALQHEARESYRTDQEENKLPVVHLEAGEEVIYRLIYEVSDMSTPEAVLIDWRGRYAKE